jgi:hypothetical protein
MIVQTSKNIGVRRTINDYNATSSFDAEFDNYAGRYAGSFNLDQDVYVYADNGSYVFEPFNQLGSWTYGFNSISAALSSDYSQDGSSLKIVTQSGTGGYGTTINNYANLFYDLPTLTSGTKIGFYAYLPGSLYQSISSLSFSLGSVVAGASQANLYKTFTTIGSQWNKFEVYLGSMSSAGGYTIGSLQNTFYKMRLVDSYNPGSLGPGSYAYYMDNIYAQSTDGANKRLFKGVIEDINYDANGLKERATISGRDLGAILQDNTVAPIIFKNTDAGQIARQIIAQNVDDSRLDYSTISDTGITIEKITFSHISVFDALSKVAELCNYYWYVDEFGKVRFIEKETIDSGVTYGIPIIDGLITHWKMDSATGSDEIIDSIGSSNCILDTALGQFTSGLWNNCLEIYSSDGIGVPATGVPDTELNKTGGDYQQYSVSFWLNTSTNPSSTGRILEKTGGGVYPFVIRFTNTGRLQCALYDGVNNPSIASTNSLSDGTWQHCVFTVDRDAHEMKTYVNSQLNQTVTDTTTGNINNSGDLIWGNNTGLNREFVGKVDDFRIYSKTLDSGEINALYNGGRGVKYSYAGAGQGNVRDARFRNDDSQIFNEVRVYGDKQFTGKRQFYLAGIDSIGSSYYFEGKPHNVILSVSGTGYIIQPGGILNINNPDTEDVKFLVDFQGMRFVTTSGAVAGDNHFLGSYLQADYQVTVPILSIKRDETSQEAYGIKEKVIVDKNIKDPVEAQIKATSFLANNKDPKIQGDLDIKGVINVFPGYTARINLPNMGVEYQNYTINQANYDFNNINNNNGNVLKINVNRKLADFTDTIKEQMLRLRQLEAGDFEPDITNLQTGIGSLGISGQTVAVLFNIGSGFFFHTPNHNLFESPSSLLGPIIGGSTLISLM